MNQNKKENNGRTNAKKNDWFKAPAKEKWKAVIAELKTSNREFVEYIKVWEPGRTNYLEEHEFYCGIDTHKNSWRAAIFGLDKQHHTDPILGPVTDFEVNTTGRKALLEMLEYFGVTRVLMEVSGVYTFPLYDLLRESGKVSEENIYVMNPRQIPRDPNMIRKTDTTDAMRLSRIASHPDLLTRVSIETKEHRAIRAMVRFLKKKSQEKNRYENRLKGFMSSLGFVVEYSLKNQYVHQFLNAWCDSTRTMLADFTDQLKIHGDDALITLMGGYQLLHDEFGFVRLEPTDKRLLGLYLSEVITCQTELESLSRAVFKLLSTHPVYHDLYQKILDIPGVGEISAAIIVTESNPLNRFPSVRKYQAYCGLAPKLFQSGETVRTGSSYKMSNRRLFFAFKQAGMAVVNHVKGCEEANLDLGVPLYRYAKRLNDSGLKYLKMVHKVASKICKIVYSIANNGHPYSDNYTTAQPAAVEIRDKQLSRQLKRLKKEVAYLNRRGRRALESRFAMIPNSMQEHLERVETLSDLMLSEIRQIELKAQFKEQIEDLTRRLSRNAGKGGGGR
jgi:transposase